MRVIFLVALLASLAHPVVHAVPVVPVTHDLSGAVPIEVASDPEPQGATLPPIGDTYSGAPLVQGNGAFYMRSPEVTTHTFDESPEAAGANLFGAAGDTFVVTESVTLSGDILTVRTRWTNINSDGNPAPWVAAGVVSPNGDTLVNWRLDVAALAGGTNTIDVPGFGYVPGTGIARALNSAGNQIGAGGLGQAPPGGASELHGVAVFAAGGNNIAGLDLAVIQFEWQMEPLPSITSVNPDSGPDYGGTSVTITGDHFNADASASFGGVDCTGIVVTVPDTLTCVTPAGTAGLVDVTVTNPSGGSGTLVDGYEYIAAPSVVSVTPGSGPAAGDTAVTISGSDFQSAASASFGGSACTGIVVTVPDTITCTTPVGTPGLVDVTVTNPDSRSGTLADGFEYVAAPLITSVSPDSGPVAGGTAVAISGSDFQAGASASFDGAACTGIVVTVPDTITCTTPAGTSGLVDVTVTNPDSQSATLADGYEYVAAPAVANINPDSGPAVGGTAVTISGSDFQTGASASFDGAACTGIVVTVPDTITCTTPAGTPGLVDVTVSNPDSQSATLANGYAYVAAPSIGSISPESDLTFGGVTVVITGDEFQEGAQVFFNGTACEDVVVDPPNTISCTVPPGPAGAVNVTVQNPDGQSDMLALGFTYLVPTLHHVPTLGPLMLVLLSLLMLGAGAFSVRGTIR